MTVAIDEARRIAVLVLHDVLEMGAFANLSSIRLLENRKLSARDRAFASALIYGTISRLVAIDYLLDQVSNRPLAKLQPLTRTILRLGAWQLYYSTSVPPAAAVDESVKLARQLENPGSAALVNACLRRLSAADRPQLPANKPYLAIGLPPELFGYLKKWYGQEEAIALGESALEANPTVTVRVNTMKSTPDLVRTRLEEEGIVVEPGRYCPQALRLQLGGHSIRSLTPWQEGLITVQDEAAMLVGLVAAPKPGERVVDLCAAPGGKTTHLAERMGDQGMILAIDAAESRVPLIDEQSARLGLRSIRSAVADATADDWSVDLVAQADLVLADVPCSGLGLLGRKPEIRLNMNHEKIIGLYPLQQKILAQASRLVRPGGRLIYSTCTINPAENIGQIETFLASDETSDFALESLAGCLPANLLDFADIAATAAQGFIQLLPHRHHTDGFFIAQLRRT